MTVHRDIRTRSQQIADAAVAPLALLTPFVGYLRYHEYPLLHAEVLSAALMLVAVGLLIDALIALRPRALRPAFLVVLPLLAADLQFHLVEARLAGATDPLFTAVAAGAAFVAAAALAWLLRDHLGTILATMFGVMLLSAVLLPTDKVATGVRIDRESSAARDLPPVLHLVFDEHIGIAGIPADIPGGAELRSDLESFYGRWGFELHPRAYSAFAETHYSLAALVNGVDGPPSRDVLGGSGAQFVVRHNSWFERLAARGYRLRVYQSQYLDFCSGEDSAVDHCFTYPVHGIGFLGGLEMPAGRKAALLVGYFTAKSVIGAFVPALLPGVADEPARRPRDLPELGTPAALDVLERAAADLRTGARGTVFFVHALVPHYAYVFDRDCQPLPDPADWLNAGVSSLLPGAYNTEATRERRYRRYFEQMRCVYRRLDALFAQMQALGVFEDATVIVHGDHGSRISRAWFRELGAAQVSARDLIDNLSTLYAVRVPGMDAGRRDAQTSVQQLFASGFLEQMRTEPDPVFLRVGAVGGAPYRERAMPAMP